MASKTNKKAEQKQKMVRIVAVLRNKKSAASVFSEAALFTA